MLHNKNENGENIWPGEAESNSEMKLSEPDSALWSEKKLLKV